MPRKEESSREGGIGSGFSDFADLFAPFKFPAGSDMGAFTHSYQRNVEALMSANRIAWEASQAYLKRNVEVVQEGLARLTQAIEAYAGSEEPKDKLAKQLELMKEARERTITAMDELRALIEKANREVTEVLSARFTEAIGELESALTKTGRSSS